MIVNPTALDLCRNGGLGEEKCAIIMRTLDTGEVVKLQFGGIRDSDDYGWLESTLITHALWALDHSDPFGSVWHFTISCACALGSLTSWAPGSSSSLLSLWHLGSYISAMMRSWLHRITGHVHPDFHLPQERSQGSGMTTISNTESTEDDIVCKLCNKLNQDPVEVMITPIIIGGTYRLELNSPGLYHCRKTGIKFQVKGPVIIEYKPESWVNHLKQIPDSKYEILGSLFNIKTSGDPKAVSAVHLPHFLCLKGNHEDRALIKCAHFQDGNLTLMNPTQIDPFYIVLENPIFSLLGALLSIVKRIRIHGIVLIYFKIMCRGDPAEEYRIHLYVLPHTINAEENLDKENKQFGFQRIKKPEQTIVSVYTKVKYLVTGRPVESICPQTVEFQAERYNYTEIQLKEKDVNICLYSSEENTKDQVWQVYLTKSDINDIIQSLSQRTIFEVPGACPPNFMEEHRAALIERTTSITPVTDNLLSQNVLTQEQYDTVRSRTPDQEKMRQLFEYMRSWGPIEKDKFYQALYRHNRHLIRDLEAKDDTDGD